MKKINLPPWPVCLWRTSSGIVFFEMLHSSGESLQSGKKSKLKPLNPLRPTWIDCGHLRAKNPSLASFQWRIFDTEEWLKGSSFLIETWWKSQASFFQTNPSACLPVRQNPQRRPMNIVISQMSVVNPGEQVRANRRRSTLVAHSSQ